MPLHVKLIVAPTLQLAPLNAIFSLFKFFPQNPQVAQGWILRLFNFCKRIYIRMKPLEEGTIGNISGDVGLVSAGRINKDTPPLTTPGHTSKSSAMDISSHIF